MEITAIQIILIVILVLTIPIGLWNQHKRNKMKKDTDASMYSSYNAPNLGGNMGENEKKSKDYIEQYKSQYPRESLKQGLLNMGVSDSEAESYLSKYFN